MQLARFLAWPGGYSRRVEVVEHEDRETALARALALVSEDGTVVEERERGSFMRVYPTPFAPHEPRRSIA